MVTLFKGKGTRSDPNNYRGIFLLEVTGKVFARIIVNRILPVMEERLDPWQFGFRPKRGTLQAISILRRIQEEGRYRNQKVYGIFIDLEKAFDSVPREVLWACLKRFGLTDKILCLIKEFHENFIATVGNSNFPMERGVRQGCVMRPSLFNLVFNEVIKTAILKGLRGGVTLIDEQGIEF